MLYVDACQGEAEYASVGSEEPEDSGEVLRRMIAGLHAEHHEHYLYGAPALSISDVGRTEEPWVQIKNSAPKTEGIVSQVGR